MKILVIYLIHIFACSESFSQVETVTNSFENHYNQTDPTLKYKYDVINQIHSYSDNWDLDLDGKADKVLFIGTGGAHLYYYLRIVLTSNNIESNLHFIDLDLPILTSNEELKKTNNNPVQALSKFAVFDFDGDNIKDIFINLDVQSAKSNSKQLKKHGITSRTILITFKNGKIKFSNYIDKQRKNGSH